MPIIRLAPAFLAPIATAKPTAPNPQMAAVDPGSIAAVFKAAPYPVEIPQPRRQTFSSGASGFTYTISSMIDNLIKYIQVHELSEY